MATSIRFPVPSIVIRKSDGFILSSGHSASMLQLDAMMEGCPADCLCVIGIEAPNGGYYRDGAVVPVPPPPVTIDDVKAEQRRRLRYTDGYISRAADPTDGRPVPAAIISERHAIRDGARWLEAMTPIPLDYRDQKYWEPTA